MGSSPLPLLQRWIGWRGSGGLGAGGISWVPCCHVARWRKYHQHIWSTFLVGVWWCSGPFPQGAPWIGWLWPVTAGRDLVAAPSNCSKNSFPSWKYDEWRQRLVRWQISDGGKPDLSSGVSSCSRRCEVTSIASVSSTFVNDWQHWSWPFCCFSLRWYHVCVLQRLRSSSHVTWFFLSGGWGSWRAVQLRNVWVQFWLMKVYGSKCFDVYSTNV